MLHAVPKPRATRRLPPAQLLARLQLINIARAGLRLQDLSLARQQRQLLHRLKTGKGVYIIEECALCGYPHLGECLDGRLRY